MLHTNACTRFATILDHLKSFHRVCVCLFEMRCINFVEINIHAYTYTHRINVKTLFSETIIMRPKNVYEEFKFVSLLLAIDIWTMEKWWLISFWIRSFFYLNLCVRRVHITHEQRKKSHAHTWDVYVYALISTKVNNMICCIHLKAFIHFVYSWSE